MDTRRMISQMFCSVMCYGMDSYSKSTVLRTADLLNSLQDPDYGMVIKELYEATEQEMTEQDFLEIVAAMEKKYRA